MTRVKGGTCKSHAPGTSSRSEDRSLPEHVDEIEISDRHRMYKVSKIRADIGERKKRRKKEKE